MLATMKHASVTLTILNRQALVATLAVFALATPTYAEPLEGCKEHVKYGAPSQNPILLCRLGFALSFNTEQKVPDWVAYHLTSEKVHGTHPRVNAFRADDDLPQGKRSELKDYKNSGFDRGHMAPAGSMKWDQRAMRESFLLSNMAPQIGIGFNRHIWKTLEEKVRKWTDEREELYVVTGPIYASPDPQQIGPNDVSVPTHFYKVIFDPIRVEAIAFILPNKKLRTNDLPTFIKSVDQVETETGLDFLSELEDTVENLVEAVVQPDLW